MNSSHQDSHLSGLTKYVTQELLTPDEADGIEADTPLLEWGLLNSVRWARLVAHMRKRMGVRVPPAEMTKENFRDLNSIATLMDRLAAAN